MTVIACQCCRQQLPTGWRWLECDTCSFRICPQCIGKHSGPFGAGFKCSQCAFGHLAYS